VTGIVSILTWVSMLASVSVPDDIQQLACLEDGTVVGRDAHDLLRRWRDGDWEAPVGTGKLHELWAAPGGHVYAREAGPRIGLLEVGLSERFWTNLPALRGGSFTFATDATGGTVIVTTDEVVGLEKNGAVVRLGAPPLVQSSMEFRPSQPATIIATGAGWLACFPNSPFEVDRGMKGVCVRPGPPRYDYRVDFGRYADRTRARPFACGDAVISAIGDETQARRLADGRRVGHVAGAPRTGSRCLPDGRILIVGARELRFFDGPALGHPRRLNVPGQIRDAAACAGRLAVLLESSQTMLIDPPNR